ncbi:hypothetical protein NDU88_000599 [Pleurodeles waltl]|uniref:Uncharacterized protein n=1 Tax=Pleurodeles waltl TaxID=8319 RepID=A0AAV7LV35_PLEWA|nr:hypothetical protein NDU88_000599 [Pleurodeles waltl]
MEPRRAELVPGTGWAGSQARFRSPRALRPPRIAGARSTGTPAASDTTLPVPASFYAGSAPPLQDICARFSGSHDDSRAKFRACRALARPDRAAPGGAVTKSLSVEQGRHIDEPSVLHQDA